MTVTDDTLAALAKVGKAPVDLNALSGPAFVAACGGLEPKARLYAGLYLATMNAPLARRMARITAAEANSPDVIRAISVGISDFKSGLEQIASQVLDRLARIAFTTALDVPFILPVDADPREHIPKELWPAVKAVKRKRGLYTKDGVTLEEPYLEIVLHDQVRVLDMINKIVGETVLRKMTVTEDSDAQAETYEYHIIEPENLEF